jgi:hypothetical protein
MSNIFVGSSRRSRSGLFEEREPKTLEHKTSKRKKPIKVKSHKIY